MSCIECTMNGMRIKKGREIVKFSFDENSTEPPIFVMLVSCRGLVRRLERSRTQIGTARVFPTAHVQTTACFNGLKSIDERQDSLLFSLAAFFTLGVSNTRGIF